MRRRRTENACEGDPSNSSGALTSRAAANKGKNIEGRNGGIVPNVSPELRALLNRDIIRAK